VTRFREFLDELRPDEAGSTDDDDLHLSSFSSVSDAQVAAPVFSGEDRVPAELWNPPTRQPRTLARDQLAAAPASRITFETSPGWVMSERWPALSFVMCAPARLDISSCSASGIT